MLMQLFQIYQAFTKFFCNLFTLVAKLFEENVIQERGDNLVDLVLVETIFLN